MFCCLLTLCTVERWNVFEFDFYVSYVYRSWFSSRPASLIPAYAID